MARKLGDSPIKRLRLTADEIEDAKMIVAKTGLPSVSSLGREIIEDFLADGSDYVAPEAAPMQIQIPPDVVKRAEEKARAEHGVGLKEIMRHELAKRATKARRARGR